MPKLVPIHYTKLIQLFERFGFKATRYRGDHIMMNKPGVSRPLVIKTSPPRVSAALIRINLTTAGISREQYFRALAEF
ncbi:MAG: hypothetical protein A3H70_01470 [Candidatus Komeilibacteria bacterium RIFCSPLOWO2_02_FULL_48_11]|uniref:Type II toxin-antitoxin system HicA family toxin n=1 Tax=Candidatus Komeilibacteria bacterium RIFCSPLOWO2_02_FULL_48_11 TaxID=1798553 RepID=A0A1G2BTW7_9BACT|nr:MAG: hypothetical protein A3H70_01470 [Candidatus Komeilibacteria bacterium RIFCSPLOWO2_02_FULL_48_11]